MSKLVEILARYGAYHRDRRNLATHMVGIPLIVLAAAILLSRPRLDIGGLPISAALIASALAAIYYLSTDLVFGLCLTVLLALADRVGLALAAAPTGVWLISGLGLMLVGWILQFIGHGFEGRKPAFLTDLVSLLVGPLFVLAEAAFAIGLRKPLHAEVQARTVQIP